MTRARIVDFVVGIAFVAMALEFGWSLLVGSWGGVPPAVIVAGGIGGVVVVIDAAMTVVRRCRARGL